MKTRYGQSPWVQEFPDSRRPAFPPLRGEQTADVVVVGGGLTGVLVAHTCAMARLDTVLVEADRIGQGSAGRSAGLLLADPGPMFRDVVAAHGLRVAKHVFELWRRAALEAAALLRRLNVRCGLTPLTDLTLAMADEETALRREATARREARFEAVLLPRAQLRATAAVEAGLALRRRDAFALDPYRACLGIAAAARRRGARLFERTAVHRVRYDRRSAQVETANGSIASSHVVVTTGVVTDEFASLKRHFDRCDTYLVLTEPVPAAVRRQIGAVDVTFRDLHHPRRRVRWAPGDRLLIAGADQGTPPPRARDGVLVQRTGQLMYELLTMFPAIAGLRPEYGWELTYGDTADGLMFIGPHRNYPHHLFALGGDTDSITGAFLAARILTRALQGVPDRADAAFGFTR